MNSPQGHWTLRTDDRFRLTDPSGTPVHLPYRKVEELLSILCSNQKRSIARETLARDLWPEANRESRRVNLRQTLCRLREAIGKENVVSDRYTCGLAPEMLLAWDDQGAGKAAAAPEGDRYPTGLMSGFVRMVEWLAENDPQQMFDMMRANYDFGCGMFPGDILRVVETANRQLPVNHGFAGWAAFWRGFGLIAGHAVPEARQSFAIATESGVFNNDPALVASSAYWQGACEILVGRANVAVKLASDAGAFVSQKKNSDQWGKTERLQSTALLHMGRTKDALRTLETVSGYGRKSTLDHAVDEALRAYYLATAGLVKEAQQVLAEPRRVEAETNHTALRLLCGLAESTLAALDSPQSSLNRLEKDVRACSAAGYAHFELYSREMLAVAHFRSGNQPEATQQIRETRKIRRDLRSVYSEWDRLRLNPILPFSQSVA